MSVGYSIRMDVKIYNFWWNNKLKISLITLIMRPPCYCHQQTPFGILISSSRFNPAGMASEETETVIDLPYGVTFITLTTRLDWKSLKCSCPSAAFIWPNVGRINGVTLYNNGLLSCRPLHLDRLKHQHLHHPLEHLHRHSSKCQLQKTRLRLRRKSIKRSVMILRG